MQFNAGDPKKCVKSSQVNKGLTFFAPRKFDKSLNFLNSITVALALQSYRWGASGGYLQTFEVLGLGILLSACGQLAINAQNQENEGAQKSNFSRAPYKVAVSEKETANNEFEDESDQNSDQSVEAAGAAADGTSTDSSVMRTFASVKNASALKVLSSFAYAINPKAKVSGTPDVMFVDLFDTSASKIKSYKDKDQRVICYFSAGTRESWRSDKNKFPSKAVGKKMEEWDGENWVDYRDSGVRSVMSARIATAKSKGCEGIDPDNIDGHLNSTNFSLKSSDQKSYISFLASEARAKGMLMGLKNSAETASKLVDLVDFAVVEECHAYGECSSYSSFSKKGKAIFQVEYRGKSSSLCSKAKSQKATLIFSDYDLKSFKTCL